jgi:hypothetical protein
MVGAADEQVLELNLQAQQALAAPSRLEVIPDATHLFEEPGAMEQVIDLARDWLVEHLAVSPATSTPAVSSALPTVSSAPPTTSRRGESRGRQGGA